MKTIKHVHKTVAIFATLLLGMGSQTLVAGENDAMRSLQIKVPDAFVFSSHQRVDIDISVTDEAFQPLAGAMIYVFAILSEQDRETGEQMESQHLVHIGRTDGNGWLIQAVDLPHYVDNLRVQVKALGYEKTQDVQLALVERVQLAF